MASGRRLRRFTHQATQEATAQFGPQESALAALLQQAADDRLNSIASGTSAARGVGAAASAAIPVTRQAFSNLGSRQENIYGGLTAQLQNLSGTADPFKGAALNEQALARSELARESTSTQTELTQRQVDAAAQEAQTVQNANVAYHSQAQKIADQATALAGARGAFTSSTIDKLMQQASRDALTRRGQNISRDNASASRDLTRRGQDITKRGQDLSHADAQKKAAAKQPTSGLGSLNPKDERAIIANVQRAADLVDQTLGTKVWAVDPSDPTGKKKVRKTVTHSMLRQMLQNGQNPSGIKFDPAEVTAAFDLNNHGGILSGLGQSALHSLNAHVPHPWRPQRQTAQTQAVVKQTQSIF